MNKVVGDSKVLTTRCRCNRTVSVSVECQNSDGCVGNPLQVSADVARQDDTNERSFE